MDSIDKKAMAKEFLVMTGGTAIVAAGSYFFKFPNNFSTGGVSGISVILGSLFPNVSSSIFASTINVLFLILGFIFLNKGCGFKTAYCSLLFSGLLAVFEWLFPMSAPFTDQKILELFFAVLLPSFGAGILFNLEASTGGTDIVAMILQKYSTLNIGVALLYVDVAIVLASFLVFDVETALCSVLGLILKSVLVDNVIESLNRKKSFLVVTGIPDAVCSYITSGLHRSATCWEAQGGYSHEQRWVVLTALSRSQAVSLRRYLKRLDPHAFMLITNSSEIFGKGFLRA